MAHTPGTATLLRQLRREQGRPLRENGADIGIHRDRETALRCARVLDQCHTALGHRIPYTGYTAAPASSTR